LQSDGHGDFPQPRFSRIDLPFDPQSPAVVVSVLTVSKDPGSTVDVEAVSGKTVDSVIAGRFVNTALGGSRADLALLGKVRTQKLANKACSSAQPSPPALPFRPTTESCSITRGGSCERAANGPCFHCPFGESVPCVPDPSSRPGDCAPPANQRCELCDNPNPPPPSAAFCSTEKEYSYLLVLDSSCGG
jgi:hypothetical protein